MKRKRKGKGCIFGEDFLLRPQRKFQVIHLIEGGS